jgi:hypothetical protein
MAQHPRRQSSSIINIFGVAVALLRLYKICKCFDPAIISGMYNKWQYLGFTLRPLAQFY